MTTSTLPQLPFSLERTLNIQAPPETVFAFFQDSARWAKWWGAGSTIDAKPGGDIYIKHPGNVESAGKVLEIDAPRRMLLELTRRRASVRAPTSRDRRRRAGRPGRGASPARRGASARR